MSIRAGVVKVSAISCLSEGDVSIHVVVARATRPQTSGHVEPLERSILKITIRTLPYRNPKGLLYLHLDLSAQLTGVPS